MTGNSIEDLRTFVQDQYMLASERSSRTRRPTGRLNRLAAARSFRYWVLIVLLAVFTPLSLSFGRASQPKDKFRGTVVHAGPKAISVKSQDNIYLVRSFSYTPQLEKKIHAKPPVAGKRVTVHYFRGTDLATKVD